MNTRAMRSNILANDWRVTTIREELLENVNIMLKEKSVFNFKDDQPLASKDGEQFAVGTVEKGDEHSFVTGVNDDGDEFYLPVEHLDTDALLQVADVMCKQLEEES